MKEPHLTEQIVLRVPKPLREQLEAAAAAEDRSVAYITRRALERDLAQRNAQAA